MTDLGFDPTTLESLARAFAAFVDGFGKLRDALRRRNQAKRPEDQRKLDREVDELQADLQTLVDLITEALANQNALWTAVLNALGPPDAPVGQKGVDRVLAYVNLLMEVRTSTTKLREVVLAHENRLLALEHGAQEP
jgi:malate synthase